ncbi:hypothetical protein PP175_28350 (plasmid) [Aneurinibacillus sp. Ricciae_BoGa-3]|uniref:hypothetical protein n=1 Tax=Aneurinibacillus sp. Ricciae_BoGa-3 TaxID=3022697 RepID=UPI002342389D|nr:hypothetical protein [Aneurinibacillus sp. Ricciae_BoGa-3]WCK57103.1 hypothetical protein PP175_28350 [Aneurinibacillus sp. Ricciae_BoGa-3]
MSVPNTGFNDKMTDEMLSLLDGFTEEMEKEYLYCDEQYEKFKNSIVKLPHVNERGINVVHGCNMMFYRLSRYWLVRRDATKDYLSKEFIQKYDVDTILHHK